MDESLYPPRCCKIPFDIDHIRSLLTAELISDFHLRAQEYDTKDRTYCSTAGCSAYLYPANIKDDKGECSFCFGETCVICKGPGHVGDCPRDELLQQTLEVAAKKGWKRCSGCKRVVELRTGCNHITWVWALDNETMLITLQMCLQIRVVLCLWCRVADLQMSGMGRGYAWRASCKRCTEGTSCWEQRSWSHQRKSRTSAEQPRLWAQHIQKGWWSFWLRQLRARVQNLLQQVSAVSSRSLLCLLAQALDSMVAAQCLTMWLWFGIVQITEIARIKVGIQWL